MRLAAKLCIVVAYLLLAVTLPFMLIYCFYPVPEGIQYLPPTQQPGNGWLLPTWIAAFVLLLVAAVLCGVFRNKERHSLVIVMAALVGAVLALVAALAFKNALPEQVGVKYMDQGLSSWEFIYRHLSSVFAGGLVAIAAFIRYWEARGKRLYEENEAGKPGFDLSGAPLFADGESTLGLDSYADQKPTATPEKKPKKSQRVAARKAEK